MADARGEYWYFYEDVEPNKITVPELRSILLKHGVQYPSSAKKPVLVGLFIDQVLPQAARLQRAHARTKRSTRGIEDVPSSQASTTTDDAEDDTLLEPPPTVRRTSRRTTRANTEEEQERRAPRGKTPSRTVPTKHPRASDGEPEEQPAMRRNRKSATPAVRHASPERTSQHIKHEDDSPFTQENPFQSGSSPLGPESRERRRRTLGVEHKEKRKSDATRRKTFQPNVEQLDDGIVVPSRRTFDVPIKQEKRNEEAWTETSGGETGEEFTAEEQLEMVRERAKTGQVDILPPRRRKEASKAAGTVKAMSFTMLLTAAVALGGVWRQEKYAVGFCGVGRESTSLAGIDIPEWAGVTLPQCEPCPPHATCYTNLEVVCDKDFIKKEHPLAIGGLVPLAPTCEPDSEKTRRVNLVADRAIHVLRERKAQCECGESDKEGNLVENAEVKVSELKQELSSMKRKGMSQEEFENLFTDAIGEVVRREEVVENNDGPTGDRRLASNSLAELPLVCSIKRSLRRTVERHLWQLALALLTVLLGSYARYSITSSRAMEARAKQLAGNVFDRLANHASYNHQDPGSYPELGISMAQLRDDILRTEFSSSRRQKLWEKVQKKVELNSNIRAAVRETQSGDVARMWEWIGPVHLLEDARSSKRRSGRYSVGPTIGSSPPDSASHDTQEVKAWDEGRPIY